MLELELKSVLALPDSRARLAARLRTLAWLAFAGVIVLSPFRARIDLIARPVIPVYGDFTDILLFWSDIAIVLTLGLWLASLLAQPRPLTVGPRLLAWPIAGLIGVACLGVPFAGDVALAADNAIRLLVLAVLGLYEVNEIGSLRRLWAPVAIMVAIQAIIGIGQVLGQHSLGLAGLGEWLLAPNLGVSVVTTIDGTRILRAFGLSDHPNILGGLLAAGLILLAAVRPGGSARVRLLQLGIVGMAAVALLLTFSRGAWLALIVGAAVVVAMLSWSGSRSALRNLALAGVVGALSVAPFALAYLPALAARTDAVGPISTEVRSIAERGATAELTTQVFAAHPITGVGLGGLPLAQHALEPAFADAYQPASFVLLDAAAETGIVGGALYLVILSVPWLATWRARTRWTPDLAVASGVLAVITVVGFFDYYTWTYPAGRIWAWLALALWAVAYQSATARRIDAPG